MKSAWAELNAFKRRWLSVAPNGAYAPVWEVLDVAGVPKTVGQAESDLVERGYTHQFVMPINDLSSTHVVNHMTRFVEKAHDIKPMKPWTFFFDLNGEDSSVIICCTDEQDAVFLKLLYERN